jgi:hypothetical protein
LAGKIIPIYEEFWHADATDLAHSHGSGSVYPGNARCVLLALLAVAAGIFILLGK